jgi:hypothetical protein
VDAAKQARADAGGKLGKLGTGAGSGLLEQLASGEFSDGAYTGAVEAGEGGAAEGTGTIEDDPANAPDDVTGKPGDIMQGGQATRIVVPGGKDIWAVTYMADGIEHVYTFESKEAMIKGMGEDWADAGVKVLQDSEVNDGDTWIIGSGESMVGQGQQTYANYWGEIKEEAALEAGSRNPGLIGEYLADPEVQRIIAESAHGDWSEERTQAEIRNTAFYQTVLYPGISAFMEQGVSNPEAAYNEYMAEVSQGLALLGYERDADGTYRSTMAQLLGQGLQAKDFNRFAVSFKRAEESQDFAAALSQWTERDLGEALTFENWLDVLDGEVAGSALGDVVEKATLQYLSDQQGLDVDAGLIDRIGAETDLSEGSAKQAFEEVQASLLALGDVGLERYGLTVDDITSASTGIKSVSGRSISDIKRLASKTATELGLADDRKAKLYIGYSPQGTPQRTGLRALAGQGG